MEIRVGVMTAKKIHYTLKGEYESKKLPDGMLFTPLSNDACFELQDVTIGIQFHWQRHETQCFRGSLQIVREDHQERAINIINIEQYIESVISSEMAATSSLELLKAHAIISRSWAMNAIKNRQKNTCNNSPQTEHIESKGNHLIISRYYERDAHFNFDVCADDHCQRYQGITRIVSDNVQKAVAQTKGMVLTYDNEIADTRFYKCCGGATEPFENVWANSVHPYLTTFRDYTDKSQLPDLTQEETARQWIMSEPKAFCNTQDIRVLQQVLNNYDQETADFYRWTIQYTQQEISELVARKSGIDFGTIETIEPIERGQSGRLMKIKIVGTQQTAIVGKELEIRKWLSPTHLYSSAFVVDRDEKGDFILHGAGWGHGVGLCQIGAAMMAHEGYDYKQILLHYFPKTQIDIK